MPSNHDVVPDLAIGHHPVHGIVAANPARRAASEWMLERLDFQPVPGNPMLYALAAQERDGQGRTTRAVALLRRSGFLVHADAAFNPSTARGTAPVRSRAPLGAAEVAFADHPRLGNFATLDGRASALTGLVLVDLGWRHDPPLDIYALPAATGRDEALRKVADATVSLRRSGARVAVQPRLAHAVAAHPRTAPVPATSGEHGQGTSRTCPISAAALAASPARAGLPGKAPVPTPATPAPPGRPADPRIAFSRTRTR